MSDSENDNDELNEEKNPENGQSSRQLSQRARRNNHKNRSAVERYFKKILTSLSSSSSSSNESSGDDDGDDQPSKTSEEDSYESDEDDTDWSSATDQDEVNTVNPENCGTSSKSAGGDIKTSKDVDKIDAAIMSDSSDGSCEKCPICLLSFRDQEVGIPETCEHKFCFICIEEWAKNVSTCPIDRKEFASINVKENYEANKIIRKIKVQLNDKSQDGGGDMTSVELTFCEVCNNADREDLMLLCDECNRGFHLFCLSPPLAEVPQGSWYCDNCFSSGSNYSDNDVEELLEDVRDLGEPSTRLRTTVRSTPRITRTRQSERIRAAIIARTRYSRNPVVIDPNQPSTSSGLGSIIDAVNRRLAQQNRRIVRRAPPAPVASSRKKKKSRRTRRRRTRRVKQKIVEYGLDQDANKFPIEVIKSKRHKKYKKKCGSKKIPLNRRSLNHSRELLKSLPDERSRLLAQLPIPKLDLFGAKGQLDYFSSDEATDDENSSSISRDISGIGNSGGGTLIQTTSRNRIGSRRLLNRQKTVALNINNPPDSTITTGSIDLLSSILDTQERWHSTRNLTNVQIAEDGRLILKNREKKTSPVPVPNPNDINEAPMYPRGGGGNSGIGGTGRYSGGYNNNNNRGGYYNNRGGGGGGAGHNSNYRSSTDGNFNGSTSYNNYNNSGGYNQSNDFSGGSSSNFRGGRGRFPTNNYTPRGIGGNNSSTPNNPNSNIRFKFNRRSVNLPNPSTTTNTDLPTSSLAVQNEEITEGREIVSNSSHETIDSTSTSEVISDEIPTPSNIFEPPQSQINNDEERIEPMSSSINSENIVSSSDQTDKVNNVELNDDDEDDDCPNFSVYSAVSMDIAKESENSSHELSDAPTTVKKDGSSNNDTTATLGQQNSGNMPNTDQEEDGEKEEDLVQLDDDDIEDEGENIAEEEPKSGIKTKDDYPDDDGDDDDDDDDDEDDEDNDDKKSANKTIPLEHNKDNLNKTSNNNSNINSKKEKVLELYDDSDWEEWNIDKNDEEKITEEAQNYIEPASDHIITDVLVPQEEKELTEEISEEDERSYTPCLDEKQQKPDTNKFNTSNESETPLGDEQVDEAEEDDDQNEIEASSGTKPSTSGIGGLDTEMISDEDEEIFNEETQQKDNHELKDGGSHNESNNKSKWIKRRGGDGHNSFKKISKNTKERNYRDKDKKRKRSRSRSNDKENKNRGMRKKDKRKDLERYNVRTIINERPRPTKDKYGRDLSARILKSPTRSKSRQRSGSPRHSRSSSRRRTPVRRSFSRRRTFSPRRRSSSRDHRSRSRQRSFGKLRGKRSHSRSRSKSRVAGGGRLNGGKPKAKRHRSRSWTSKSHSRTRSRSISKSRSFSISRSRTRTPIDRPIKQHPINRRPRKKETRRRELSIEHRSASPRPATITTRRKKKTVVEKASRRRRQEWSASRSKTPEISWTPPYQTMAVTGNSSQNLTVTLKNKDTVRKKKDKKRKERRKEQNERRRDKKRQRADKQASPIPPSKEVFASGNNILVSVSFNKNQQQPPQQTTVVTLPASRSQIVSSAKRRDENTTRKTRREKNKDGGIGKRHKKVDMKPVAIIDLDRSPFKEMTPSPKDVIVLDDDTDEEREANKEKKTQDTQEISVTLQHEEETEPPMRVQQASQPQSPVVDDSFDLLSPGPKTPPEPPTVKFSMSVKSKNTKLRVVNPLHDAIEEEAEVLSERDAENVAAQKDQNKIGPNTPPEPAPTSPDAYDPFEPTKSPSPSPSPAPPDMGDMSTNDDDVSDNLVESTQECIKEDKRPSQTQEKILNPVELVMALINNKTASIATTSSSAHADITSTSGDNFNLQTNESQIIDITSMQSASPTDKVDDPHKQITVLSNVFIQAGTNQTSQSRVTNVVGSLLLPSMSNSGRSPIKSQFNNPTSTTNKSSPIKSITLTKQTSQKIISITQLPKLTVNTNNNNNNSSGGGASGANISDLGGDDGGNDFGSPYSPGSSDYDDLFEPPMDTSSPPPILPPIRSHKTQGNKNKNTNNNNNNNPVELFDNLFGSTSPIHMRLSSNKTKSKQQATNKMHKKTPVKVYHKPGMGKLSDDQLQILDDLPSSAVELQVKDKFLRKLNRQERVVEEVKLVLKPHYNKKHISKEEYKNIMRRAVPKICHNRTGEINPQKIQNLIEAYVKKYRHRRKILNNNAVSSSNKCVDFLNKLN